MSTPIDVTTSTVVVSDKKCGGRKKIVYDVLPVYENQQSIATKLIDAANTKPVIRVPKVSKKKTITVADVVYADERCGNVSQPIISENIESITQTLETLNISEPVSEVPPKQTKKQTKKKNVVVSEPIISENIESISQIVVDTPVVISEPVSEVPPKQVKKQTKKKNVVVSEPIVSENIESISQIVVDTPVVVSEPVSEVIPKQVKKQTK
jgi:hypothetical protein